MDITPDAALHPSLYGRGANATGSIRTITGIDAGTAQLTTALSNLAAETQAEAVFDVVVDDGSHTAADQIATFEMLFPTDYLAFGGVVFVEDVTDRAAVEYFQQLAAASVERHDIISFQMFYHSHT